MPNPKLRVSARWNIMEGRPEITYVYESTNDKGAGSARYSNMAIAGVAISGLIKRGYSLEINEASFKADLRLEQTREELIQAIGI